MDGMGKKKAKQSKAGKCEEQQQAKRLNRQKAKLTHY